jgi:hypothetical protein
MAMKIKEEWVRLDGRWLKYAAHSISPGVDSFAVEDVNGTITKSKSILWGGRGW